MNINKWNSKALSLCLMVAVFATYSMSALASPPKIAGEILVSGKTLGDITSVNVNGRNVENGSSVFSSSTIKTSGNSDAVINLGNVGKVKLAPNTNVKLSFDEKSLTGNLSVGKITLMTSSGDLETVFSVANAGQFKFAPNTSATLSITPKGLIADLKSGQNTTLSSTGKVLV